MKESGGLLERYGRQIAGVLGCFDRLVVTGTLTEIAHPEAMDMFLHHEGFRAFDIGLFAEPLRQRIRENAVELARRAGIEIDALPKTRSSEYSACKSALRWKIIALWRSTIGSGRKNWRKAFRSRSGKASSKR